MAALSPKTISREQQNLIDTIDANSVPSDDLAAQLNALNVGGGDGQEELQPDFKNDGTSLKQDQGAETPKTGKQEVQAFKDNLVSLFNAQKAQSGETLSPALMFNGDSEMTFQQFGISGNSLMTFGQTAQAASMIASGTQAGQIHPGTQMVAATLRKAGKGRDDSVMTLKLDPPELGNVSIKLQFGKDKTVKAVISAEKPETFLMLQRDAHALERALQSSGLETGKDALTFELQDHGSFAQDDNGERGGDKSFGRGNAGTQDAADIDIIQSSVMWQVDPSTGHVRYNLLA
jgi:flagellar hook-length control protein FliK